MVGTPGTAPAAPTTPSYCPEWAVKTGGAQGPRGPCPCSQTRSQTPGRREPRLVGETSSHAALE